MATDEVLLFQSTAQFSLQNVTYHLQNLIKDAAEHNNKVQSDAGAQSASASMKV